MSVIGNNVISASIERTINKFVVIRVNRNPVPLKIWRDQQCVRRMKNEIHNIIGYLPFIKA